MAFRQERELKQQRARLRATGKDLGLDKETVRKAVYRGEKEGQSKEAIKATLERNAEKQRRRESEAPVPSEDMMSIEEQIAALEGRLAEVHGSDAWCDVRDAIQRLKQQQGSAL